MTCKSSTTMTARSAVVRFAVCVALVWLPSGAFAQLVGRVVAVADGDTVTVLDAGRHQHRIRLADIDAPESAQPFGNRARQHLAGLCHGKDVEVRVRNRDRYGRTVGTLICNGVDANADLVRNGLAWVYVQYAAPGSPLYALEADARRQRLGLWADANPVPPWDWRRGNRSAATGRSSSAPAAVRGNSRSMVYHLPNCPNFDDISERNRVTFPNERAAVEAGFRRAGNCP